MRNNYCDIHGEYKGPWISCPRCLKIQEKIDNLSPSCPTCAALRARIEDVEGMAKVLEPILSPLKYPAGGRPEIARAVSKWLKEGKG